MDEYEGLIPTRTSHLQGVPTNVDASGFQTSCNHPLGFTTVSGTKQNGQGSRQ